MKRRTRRGLLLLVVSVVSGTLLFAAVVRYVADVNSRVGPEREVLVLATDVGRLAAVGPAQVRVARMPVRYVPENALGSPAQLEGLVSVDRLRRGSLLQWDMVRTPPALLPGQRALTVSLKERPGGSRGIRAGDHVDVLGTVGTKVAAVVLGVLVLDGSPGGERQEPYVTLALTPQQVVKVTRSRAKGRLDLVVLPGTDQEEATP